MKKSNRESVIGLVVALSLPLGLPGLSVVQSASAAPQKQPASTLKVPTVIDAGVAQAEKHLRLITVGLNNGTNTNEDVSEAKIALADTRIRAALDRNEFIGLRQDLETIVTQRQSLLDRMNARWRVGAVTSSDVNTAEEALAEARVRLDLYSVLLARQARLSETSVRQSSGISTAAEMEKVTAALQRAELRFVESGDDR